MLLSFDDSMRPSPSSATMETFLGLQGVDPAVGQKPGEGGQKKRQRERQPLLIQFPYNKQNLFEIREAKWLVPGQHMIWVK